MTREQFLTELYHRLPGLTQKQAEQHLTYYAEMLADRMEEGMTEDEAVASMEPLDTIARRILQDEGVPNAAAQPPKYPDLPQTDASRFTKVPEMPRPKRKKLLWPLSWLLVAAVIAAALIPKLGGASRDSSTPTTVVEGATDYGYEMSDWGEDWKDWENWDDYEFPADWGSLDGLQIGPDGIYGENFQIGPDGIYISGSERDFYIGPDGLDIPTAEYPEHWMQAQFKYEDDTYQVDRSAIFDIQVNWNSGAVEVRGWDGDTIQFQEFSDRALTQNRKLQYSEDGSTLTISSKNGEKKGLLLLVPKDMLYLCVNTTAADVYWHDLAVDSGEVQATSGDITLMNTASRSLSSRTTSGETILRNIAAQSLEARMTSGSIQLHGVAANDMEISGSSGSVTGYLAGNSVEIETSSGKISVNAMSAGNLSLDSSSGKIRTALADGSSGYTDIETSSGNVTLLLNENLPFQLEFDSSSGYFDKGDFQVIRSNGLYISEGNGGSGGCFFDIETTSGDLQLETRPF